MRKLIIAYILLILKLSGYIKTETAVKSEL